ncbi:MAG: hypothetical protein KC501_17705 [Myxococcales bacterium]|nr:hypothetical protein [Myxococcales bacterium]
MLTIEAGPAPMVASVVLAGPAPVGTSQVEPAPMAVPEGADPEGQDGSEPEGRGTRPQGGSGTEGHGTDPRSTPPDTPEGPAPELEAPPPSAAEDSSPDVAAPPEPAIALAADPSEQAPEEEPEPAPLPEAADEAPTPAGPRAMGGALLTPLPPAPEPEDPSSISSGPWRGRGWLGFGLAASVPLGGTSPAAGSVVAAAGEISLGWRLNRWLALHTALSSYAHDSARRNVVVDGGDTVEEVAFGRVTAFDLVTARFYLPVLRRIDPWAEAGMGVGIRRAPFAAERQAVGLARLGLGVDFWLAPSFTLGVMTAYRLAIIGKTVGHGLRAGVDLGIHW